MTASLVIENAIATVGGRQFYGPLEFTVTGGAITTVMGPSGSGKSTLLSFVAGTLARGVDATGRVTLNGRPLTGLKPEARRIGVLFQDAVLFPHLSVGQNLSFGLPAAVKGAARVAAIDKALADAGLEGIAHRDPGTLSGGERARVALMRTLLAQPEAVLLDEPFSKLDAARREDLRQFVFTEISRRGLPAILVTHDPADADAAGGPIIQLDSDQSSEQSRV